MPPQTPPPADFGQNPLFPPGTSPLVFDTFNGVNTSASRPGIRDDQCYWIDGFIPLGKNNLRTIYGVGEALYTAVSPLTIVFFAFGNLGETPICVVLLSDGSIVQVNTDTGVATTMAAASTISNPSTTGFAVSQWGSQYIIIVADQTNGYWLWDGTNMGAAGTISLSVTITNGGSGYTSGATVGFSGGSGSGATATATVVNGIVTEITVTNPGSGYVVGDTVTVTITPVGAGSGATATVSIMPFGIQGNAVETYTGRVWVARGAKVFFTAPSNPSDFGSTNGGGSFTSRDSFLRVGYMELIQTNGFLYLLGDSSINYISGVQTGGSPLVTTFTNQNADPEIGTPWAPTVDVFSRNILFANAFGVHVSYGGAVAKVSEALDGVYNTVPNFGDITPSATKATLFGQKCWALLLPIICPICNEQVNKLLMWDQERWWATGQDVDLIYVQHQEINSILTAYGTDGDAIYPLFQQPSTGFLKRVQSKLWDNPGSYAVNKTTSQLFGIANYYVFDEEPLTISVDSELGQSDTTYNLTPLEATWYNAQGDVVTWQNALGADVIWYVSGVGVVVFPPTSAGQQGALLGLTLETNASDVAIISLMLVNQAFNFRGA